MTFGIWEQHSKEKYFFNALNHFLDALNLDEASLTEGSSFLWSFFDSVCSEL